MKTTMNKTPRERAEALLALHNGCCSVSLESDVGKAFEAMESEGLVRVESASVHWPDHNLVTIYAKDYKPEEAISND